MPYDPPAGYVPIAEGEIIAPNALSWSPVTGWTEIDPDLVGETLTVPVSSLVRPALYEKPITETEEALFHVLSVRQGASAEGCASWKERKEIIAQASKVLFDLIGHEGFACFEMDGVIIHLYSSDYNFANQEQT